MLKGHYLSIEGVYGRGTFSVQNGIQKSRSSQSIKNGKSDLIDIDCIDQSVEIDDTLVSFIDLSRFYRSHRFISKDTGSSVHQK